MRTAIFVCEPTTVTIKTTDKTTEILQLVSFHNRSAMAVSASALTVPAGIYKVVSASQVSVASASAQTVVMSTMSDKDRWPDPPAALLKRFAGTSPEAIQDFFAIPGAKSFVP